MKDKLLSGGITIRKDNPIPIYYQIKEQLYELIKKGKLKHGDMLPSEEEWARELEISRMTLRNALLQLVTEGVLYRKKGKGTFVNQVKTPIFNFETSVFSFSDMFKNKSGGIQKKILDQKIITAPNYVLEKLNLPSGAKAVSIKNLRLLDGEPSCLEYNYYPADRFDWLAEEPLEDRSIYSLLKERGIVPWETVDELELGTIASDEAELLGISKKTPVLYGARTAWDKTGKAIEFYQLILRGDHFRMVGHTKQK